MNIFEQLKSAEKILNDNDIEDARLEAEILLCHLLRVEKIFLYVNPDKILSDEQIADYKILIQRKINHEPTAYIIGHREFMDLNLIVTKDVLIPRPETEILVETVIDKLNNVSDIIKIADIGSGSGAITISLAKHLMNSFIDSVDISESALKIAELNAEKYHLSERIEFFNGDIFSTLTDKKYKAIVSNPPYIPSKIIDSLQAEVKNFEPRISLDGGDDGLNFYRRLIEESPKFLIDDGFLAVEIGYDQAAAVKHLLEENGQFKDIEIIKDLSKNDRVVVAKIGN